MNRSFLRWPFSPVLASCLLVCSAATATADQWTELHPAAKPTARAGHTMVTIDGVIYLFGGYERDAASSNGREGTADKSGADITGPSAANGPVSDLWKFDGQNWQKIADNHPPPPRYLHTAIVYRNKMFVFGGQSSTTYFNDTWEYDPNTRTWLELPPGGLKPEPRSRHSAVMEDGSMIVFGGKGANGQQSDAYAWSFNLTTQTWTRKSANPSGALDCHSATMVGNKMYVFGGNSGSTKKNDVFSYDPAADTWTKVSTQGTSPDPRAFSAMTTEGTSFLIFGGENNSGVFFNDTWEFNTITNTWTRRGNIPLGVTRAGAATIQVANTGSSSSSARPAASPLGQTYQILFGGVDANGNYSDKTYKYATNTGNNCSATLAGGVLHVPIITYGGASYWADLQQSSSGSSFAVSNSGAVTDTSPYSSCLPATLSSSWQLHVPEIIYGGVSYRADFQYENGTFSLTGAVANQTAR